jgi:3-oxoadipate enol-lactonase
MARPSLTAGGIPPEGWAAIGSGTRRLGAVESPRLPPARALELAGRGRAWVYDSGPAAGPDRPALLLLHGWTSTAALNWHRCFPALSAHYRVLALDLRGHGRGIRSRVPFRLEDCADDAAALVTTLGLGPVTAVGYSMGGPVAQLLWRRHREVVDGLVLCATAARFGMRQELGGPIGTLSLGASMALSLLPEVVRRQGMTLASRNWAANRVIPAWAIEEWERNDPGALIQAGLALGRFDSTGWIGTVDVPAALVVTTLDTTVLPRRQWNLARSIPEAVAFPVQANHRACVEEPGLFVPALMAACRAAQAAGTVGATGTVGAEPTA